MHSCLVFYVHLLLSSKSLSVYSFIIHKRLLQVLPITWIYYWYTISDEYFKILLLVGEFVAVFVNCLDQCSLIKRTIKYKFEDEILKLSFVTCISTIGNLFSDDDRFVSNSNGSMMVFTRLGVEQLMSNWEFSMSLEIHDSVPYSCCV